MERQRNPERSSPEIEAKLGEVAVILTYYNTDVFVYGERFMHMNHAYVRDYESAEVGAYVFNSDLVKELLEHRFPSHYQVWPEEVDENAYVHSQMQALESEI